MKKAAFLVMLVTLLTKLAGMFREIIMSYYYGASAITDAYLISLTIPGTIFAFLGTAIGTSFIPIYNELSSKESVARAQRFTSNLISYVFLACTLLIAVFFLFPDFIINMFASGFDEETRSLAIGFTKIGFISIYASALIFIFTSYLQIQNSFIPAVISGLIVSITAIIFIVISHYYGVVYLAIGNTIGIIFQVIFLIPYIKKNKFKYKFHFERNDSAVKKMLYLSLPVMIGVSVNQINVLINKTVASQISIGGISTLTYADKLNLLIQGIFVLSLATVFYPIISKLVIKNDLDKLKSTISDVMVSIGIIIIPITGVTMVFSQEIVKLVYGRGAFDEQAVQLTSIALYYYSIGMIAFGLREILSRVYYAMQNTKTPMINAGIGVLINIVLSIILSKYLGIGGLALATSISAVVTTLLLYFSLRKKIGNIGSGHLIKSYLKVTVSAVTVAIISKFLFEQLQSFIGELLGLIISIFISIIIYLLLIFLLRVREVRIFYSIIKTRFTGK